MDALIFYTDGAAPQYQAPNVRFERMTRDEIAKRISDAFEYATGKPQHGLLSHSSKSPTH